jgi:hypothetical protein
VRVRGAVQTAEPDVVSLGLNLQVAPQPFPALGGYGAAQVASIGQACVPALPDWPVTRGSRA